MKLDLLCLTVNPETNTIFWNRPWRLTRKHGKIRTEAVFAAVEVSLLAVSDFKSRAFDLFKAFDRLGLAAFLDDIVLFIKDFPCQGGTRHRCQDGASRKDADELHSDCLDRQLVAWGLSVGVVSTWRYIQICG